jgi:hypothetical protein
MSVKNFYKNSDLDHSKVTYNHINSINYLGFKYAWSSDAKGWIKMRKIEEEKEKGNPIKEKKELIDEIKKELDEAAAVKIQSCMKVGKDGKKYFDYLKMSMMYHSGKW